MESQIDRDFQTAVSTQSQMCTSPSVVQNTNQTLYSSPHWKIPTKHCKISTKHWESIQVHKLQFCSHFSTAGEWWGCSELHIHFYWKYFHKTCFQSAWNHRLTKIFRHQLQIKLNVLQNKNCSPLFFSALSALWNARGSTSTNSAAYVISQPASRLNCILLKCSPPSTWLGLNYNPWLWLVRCVRCKGHLLAT